MDKRMKVVVYVFATFFCPGVLSIYMELTNTGIFRDNPFLRFWALSLACLLLAFAGIFVKEFLERPIVVYDKAACGVAKVSARFRIPKGGGAYYPLFFLSDNNGRIHTGESRYSGRAVRKHNTIYYALSAKGYFNWIDYVYFNYIRRIRDELKCRVIICLHVPDEIKACKLINPDEDPNQRESDYRNLCERYKAYVEKVIGSGVEVMTEENFYHLRSKKFASFHLVHKAFILYFASLLNVDDEQRSITFEQFKRRLSHVDSAFPIWMIAMRSKRERIFVLDNALSLQIWQMAPMPSIRARHDIYFVEANDIKYANGERINVHKKENTVNLTDSLEEIKEKIAKIDTETKKIMISLLDEGMLNMENYYDISLANIDENLYEVVCAIKAKHSF